MEPETARTTTVDERLRVARAELAEIGRAMVPLYRALDAADRALDAAGRAWVEAQRAWDEAFRARVFVADKVRAIEAEAGP